MGQFDKFSFYDVTILTKFIKKKISFLQSLVLSNLLTDECLVKMLSMNFLTL